MNGEAMSAPGELIQALQEAAARIRELEAEAGRVVQVPGGRERHRELLVEKCRILRELPDLAAPFVRGMEEKAGKDLSRALKGFARRASQALSVDSVFYMYALLYPDTYQEGEPNDLEVFLASLA